jgi:chemotaxis protein histidine kinase CheA
MADQTTEAGTAAATERAPNLTPVGSGIRAALPSLDDELAAELTAPASEVKRTAKAAPRANSNDEDGEDEIDDEDEDSDAADRESDAEADEDSELEDEDGDESEAEEESKDSKDENDEATDEDEADDESDESEAEKGPVSKGMEELAKDKKFSWAAKRIQKQSKDLNSLRTVLAQGAVALTPTNDFPLADATTDEKLRTIVSEAKDQLKTLSSLKPTDFEENEDGERVVVIKENGRRVVKTQEEVAAEIKALEAKTDSEAITKQHNLIEYRQANRPWEQAQAIAPEMFQPGTPENQVFKSLLKLNPAMKASVGDYEIVCARAIRDMRRDQESAPSKEYPKGRFKWVRYELDKKGKLKTPKRAEGEVKKPLLKRKPMTAPSGARPPSKPGGKGGRPDLDRAVSNHSKSRSDSTLTNVLMAELGMR